MGKAAREEPDQDHHLGSESGVVRREDLERAAVLLQEAVVNCLRGVRGRHQKGKAASDHSHEVHRIGSNLLLVKSIK